MRVAVGLGLLLLACGGKSASEGDAHGGASGVAGASASGSAGANSAAGGDESAAGSAGSGDAAGAAGTIDENDPAGTPVLKRQIDWLIGDAERLYWLADPNVFQGCRKDDCAHTLIDYPNNFSIPTLGNASLYWYGNNESVLACPKTGCVGAPTLVGGDGVEEMRLVAGADGEYVYWVDQTQIRRCKELSCTSYADRHTIALSPTPAWTFELLFQGADVFWSSTTGIYRAAKDGSGEAQLVATAPSSSYPYIGVNAHGVYWIDQQTQRILSCPSSGCGDSPPTVVVSTTADKRWLTVDDSGLYWVELPDHEIHHCPLSDCSQPIAFTQGGISGPYTADARYVYWVQSGGNDVVLGHDIVRRLKPTL